MSEKKTVQLNDLQISLIEHLINKAKFGEKLLENDENFFYWEKVADAAWFMQVSREIEEALGIARGS